MKNILVTGGAGFIGSNFIHYILGKIENVRIINIDKLTYASDLNNLKNLPDEKRHILIREDICNYDAVYELLSKYDIDTIVNFAAETHVDNSIRYPKPFIQSNIIGTYTLLTAFNNWIIESGKNKNIFRFHQISTDEVYGTLGENEYFTEKTQYNPRSPYSASKLAGDSLVKAYHNTYGVPITITNCSNNYGERQNTEKLIPLMITNALNRKNLPIYGDGLQVRDWIYVKDHCEAIVAVLEKGIIGETYLVGASYDITNIEVINMICNYLDKKFPSNNSYSNLKKYVEDRPGHDRRYAVDYSKIKKEIGWSPSETFESGLHKTIKWYIDKEGLNG
jgi:dTDP-glucose 4,6-dehydratase